MTKPKSDGFEKKEWEKRLSKVFGNELLEKGVFHRLKIFIRTERKAAAEEAIKAVTPEEKSTRLDCGECDVIPTVVCRHAQGFNDCRSKIIAKGEEYLKTL